MALSVKCDGLRERYDVCDELGIEMVVIGAIAFRVDPPHPHRSVVRAVSLDKAEL